MNPIGELDSADKALLREAEVLGQWCPKNSDQRLRLERLEHEGYVTAIPHDHPEPGQPPAWTYRLTHLGKQVLGTKRQ